MTVFPHHGRSHVPMCLIFQRRDKFVVVWKARNIFDHVADADVEPAPQPIQSARATPALAAVVHHVTVAEADVLDPDRDVVEPVSCVGTVFTSGTNW